VDCRTPLSETGLWPIGLFSTCICWLHQVPWRPSFCALCSSHSATHSASGRRLV
jgi:hypothetical protein